MITRGEMPLVRRVCVLAWAGAAVSWELSTPGRLVPSLATCAAFLLLATGCAVHIRRELLDELRRSQEIAGAAQRALLRPLPGRIDGLTPAAAQLSASRGAAVGGDLYEVVQTAYGIRVVIGDVRGHGLPALGAAAAVLGAFREGAYDEPSLDGVLRRMERALGRHVRNRAESDSAAAEEFVTVLLLQIARDGALLALNCGHPWPYVIARESEPALSARPAFEERVRAETGFGKGRGGGSSAQRLTRVQAPAGGETLPPLGVVPVPADMRPRACGELRPGETLFLYTDGAEDARDRTGRFFDLAGVLATEAAATPTRLVAGVHAALLRHTGGRLADDVALLVLRNDRS
ncbi:MULTISPECIES: PP2C family protein-serine/threonine phosphatase [unclassified Streptomyces]|uniref:PP2C family protein-serine/threonine phosphatase n=1 Tax=unclassified Streptomyces TaxID=2593676 RepID=UPI0007C53924|nr:MULTISPECIES: PP2C family protein-serine/threonine phosphatase [unclassified Streptomyces]